MTNEPISPLKSTAANVGGVPIGKQTLGRLGRLVLKELREIFRDRRTIITLVVMPVLIYPLLALVFQRFLVSSLTSSHELIYTIGLESSLDERDLLKQIVAGQAIMDHRDGVDSSAHAEREGADVERRVTEMLAGVNEKEVPSELRSMYLPAVEMERRVADGELNLGIVARRRGGVTSQHGLAAPLEWQLIYRPGSPTSEKALRFFEARLQALNDSQIDEQLRKLEVTAVVPGAFTRLATQQTSVPLYSLAALIPLILVLTTVTGAVYPAIDLTAGERERGTLEMLIAAPVPRLGLLLGKYVAVLAVALVTAVVNLIGMTITAKSTGLSQMLFPQQNMSLAVIFQVWLLLCLLAAFFSAVLLAITSYARSFKEAQAYIIPLMLICLVPGVICLLPSLEFNPALAVTPLMNIVMLARDVLEGGVVPELAAATVVSTALYVVAALALAARIFGTDAVLYGSPATWSDIIRRPVEPTRAASPSAAMFALAVMFPIYFILSGALAQVDQSVSLSSRLFLGVLITVLIFVAIPLAVAMYHRVRLSNGLALRRPPLLGVLAAVVLGLSLWPFAHEIFLFNRLLAASKFEQSEFELARQLVGQLRNLPPAMVIFCLGAIPALCEEFFFRGFLFGALRRVFTGWGSLVATALLFGLFHTVSGNFFAPERFLPSAFMGLALGWVRLRTGSVLPCMLLHATHNSLLLAMMYRHDADSTSPFGIDENMHLPWDWLAAAAVAVALCGLLLWAVPRRSDPDESPLLEASAA